MKFRKLTAAVLCLFILSLFCGCDKSNATETKDTTEDTTTEEVVTTTTETEITESSSDTEIPEETEENEYIKEPFYNNYAGDESEFSEIYSEFREYATALHEEDDSLLFGYGYNTAGEIIWENVLLTYDGTTVRAYRDNDGKVEEVEQEYYGYNEDEWKPETFLMPYDVFMDFPCLDSFPEFNDGGMNPSRTMDANTIFDPLEDGEYGGWYYAFSSDMKYIYCSVGIATTINKTPEECLNLKEGDEVKIGDETLEVTSVYDGSEDIFSQGNFTAVLGNIDEGGYFVVVHTDDTGAAEKAAVFSCFGNPSYSTMNLKKVPIADDAQLKISVYLDPYSLGGESSIETIKGSELKEYVSDWLERSSGAVVYEDGGIGINGSATLGFGVDEDGMPESVVIKDGEIVYMALSIYYY
ncbi:MAG: hypothetical protein J6U54_20995 [Clostridiales bacterium]|nr:hypothetical protein [Clostridiales bacterium]